MNIKKNNKGYTLIEMLGAVLILGILMAVATVSYSTIMKNIKTKYYSKQKELVIQAGREYFNDNHNQLPRKINGEKCVTLEALTTNKYIDKIESYNKKECNESTSKVCAKKINETKYSYRAELDCYEN